MDFEETSSSDRNGDEEDRSSSFDDPIAPSPSPSSSMLTDVELIDDDGRLDVSNRDLTKLPRLPRRAPEVRVLNVSGNCLKSFDGIRRFIGCEEIDASDNKIHSLGALLCVKETLRILNVSRNVILQCDQLSAFRALVTLDLSKNKLTELPVLHSLTNLQILNLSSNALTSLPSLHQLDALSELNLNSNQIASLENAKSCLPPGIELLDIGNNKISDLTNIAYLSGFSSLSSITFEGNPAVSPQGRGFCYRPYLASCLPEQLKVVDGLVLTEVEIVKGEWLCTQGKSLRYKPGTNSHSALCEYLTQVLDPAFHAAGSLQSPLEKKLTYIIEQRRKYEDQRSLESSFSASMLESFSNSMSRRRLSDASDSTVVVSSAHQSVMSANGVSTPAPVIRPSSAQNSGKRAQVKTPSSSSSVKPVMSASTHAGLFSQERIAHRFRSLRDRNDNQHLTSPFGIPRKVNNALPQATPKPTSTLQSRKPNIPLSTKNVRAPECPQRTAGAIKIQNWWRATQRRRKILNFAQSMRFEAMKRNQEEMRKKLQQFAEDNERLNKINEEQTATIAQQSATISDLVDQFINMKNELMKSREEHSAQVRKLDMRLQELEKQRTCKPGVPKPSFLRLVRQGGHVVLTWENVPSVPDEEIAEYNFYANGKLCGTAKARNRRITITDTTSGDKITVEAVATSGATSLSDPVICPSKEKENIM